MIFITEKDNVKITVTIEGKIPELFVLNDFLFNTETVLKLSFLSIKAKEIYDKCLREIDTDLTNKYYHENYDLLVSIFGENSAEIMQLKSMAEWNEYKQTDEYKQTLTNQ